MQQIQLHRATILRAVITLGMLIVALAVSHPADTHAAATTLHPDPLSLGLVTGAKGAISLQVDAVQNLYGMEVHLRFDPKVVQVVDADPGKAGTQIAIGQWFAKGFTAVNQVDNKQGKIDFAATLLNPSPPLSGSGKVATITFIGKTDGNSSLDIQATLASRDAQEISTVTQNGVVGVSAGGQAPKVQAAANPSKKSSSAGPTQTESNSTTNLILFGAAGLGVLAFVGALAFIGMLLILKRR